MIKKGSLHIEYDNSYGGYVLTFDFTKEFIEALKKAIPKGERSYLSATKTWVVDRNHKQTVLNLAKSYFLEVIDDEQPQVEPKQSAKGGYSKGFADGEKAGFEAGQLAAKTNNPYMRFLAGCSQAELKAMFRIRAKELHPDSGGNHEAFIQMKAAYDELMSKQ